MFVSPLLQVYTYQMPSLSKSNFFLYIYKDFLAVKTSNLGLFSYGHLWLTVSREETLYTLSSGDLVVPWEYKESFLT